MPRPVLTRSRVVSAGVSIVGELGLDALDHPAVARRVHATPAGVRKQISATELTEAVVALIMESMPHVSAKTNWSGRLRLWAIETREWLGKYPGLAGHLIRRRWHYPIALDRLEEVVAVFDSTDMAADRCVVSALMLFSFVVRSADADESAFAADLGIPQMGGEWPVQHRPRLREYHVEFSAAGSRTHFDFGLNVLIEGVERQFGEASIGAIPQATAHRLEQRGLGRERVASDPSGKA